jgi:hypothetical protein
MTALTSNYEAKRQDGVILDYPVVGSTTIYKGALLQTPTTGNDQGYVQPLTDDTNKVFVGVAVEGADNSSGSRGDKTVRVYKEGVYQYTMAGATQNSVGRRAFGRDDNTIGVSSTNDIFVGYIVGLGDGANTVKLQINDAVDTPNPSN